MSGASFAEPIVAQGKIERARWKNLSSKEWIGNLEERFLQAAKFPFISKGLTSGYSQPFILLRNYTRR